ncbi:glutamate--tRNA ligase [Candidatus Saccharibacteria bacterium]|nr:glutamate--tRNA ligase [Candidatus Saccharibacteria bacterium]
MKQIRTRFAPSPTGFLHVGGIRTALFAWLLARQNNGAFILRFEDTDQKREVAGARKHLMDSLHQLGLDYDEGPDIGGPFAPYTQSQRLANYKIWADKLVASGRAYADPYSIDEVQAYRDEARANKQAFLYRNHRPETPPIWDGLRPLRFKSDPKPYAWTDAVMGDLQTGPEVIDDFIVMKSDGYPTYNFAHIIDDAEMEITHIMRGQEFLASVPNYLNMYEALGLTPPIMATMPHVMAENGNKKLSKRDGAKDVLDYIRDGFMPETLRNFIASLGWNDGTEQEIFTTEELVAKFSLDHVQRSGARFDEKRLEWMNGTWIRGLPLDELAVRVAKYWPDEAASTSSEYKLSVLGLIQERLKFFNEIPELSRFFFIDLPVNPELISGNKQLKKFTSYELLGWLQTARNEIADSNFSAADLTDRLNRLLETTGQKPGVLFSLIRIATTQSPASPGLAETMALLGKDRCLERIDSQSTHLA